MIVFFGPKSPLVLMGTHNRRTINSNYMRKEETIIKGKKLSSFNIFKIRMKKTEWIVIKWYAMDRYGRWWIWLGRLGTECISTWQYALDLYGRWWIRLDIKELNGLYREYFSMENDGRWWIQSVRLETEWIAM